MQDAADHLTEEMMEKYNKETPIVWNTIQMYRTFRLEYMEEHLQRAREKDTLLVTKLYVVLIWKRARQSYKNGISFTNPAY